MKTKRVGYYEIGPTQVELVVKGGNGGGFDAGAKPGCVTQIWIGVDGEWNEVVSVLLHEALEFCFMHAGLRYCPAPDYSDDNGGYLFSMDHTQFSEATARAGGFVAAAIPDLCLQFKKWKKR